MNNSSQYMNDLSTLNDDFSQQASYRQNKIGQAMSAAQSKISDFKRAANEAKGMVPHLEMLAGEEGAGGLAGPHSVAAMRAGWKYASEKMLSPETNEALRAAGQDSFDATGRFIGNLPGYASDAGSAIARGGTRVLSATEDAIRSGLSRIGGGGGALDGVGGNAIVNDMGEVGLRPMPYDSSQPVPDFAFESKVAPPPTDAAGNYLGETQEARWARMTGRAAPQEADELAAGTKAGPALTEGKTAIGESKSALGDEGLGDALTEGAGAAGADAGTAASAASAAAGAAADAGTSASAALAAAGTSGEIAATNWWNVLGWGAALAGVGAAIYSGVEAAEEGSDAKKDQAEAGNVKANIPNMPSFAGRYVLPVQNNLQNE